MMGGVSPETCWAIKKHWNNKFYYMVASCRLFLHDLYYHARIHEHQVYHAASCIHLLFSLILLFSYTDTDEQIARAIGNDPLNYVTNFFHFRWLQQLWHMKLYWYSSVPYMQMNVTWQHTVLPSDSVTDVKTHLFT
jgi:hypothetical protein